MLNNIYSKHRAVHEVMWENILHLDWPQICLPKQRAF